ncbi:hypothetical protein HNR19_003788 [Nocardioides thalensis]|uniref:Uncharacterized protein n=1 Tax=Nocardioides thalensis TaxID=1914755 RepID=A0A853C4R3_9ACTN|nr:hypothetical protein [Nocardioides thalensis]NYJ03090.1 hypothetical protein [Nocardioides thalensis]
MAVRRLAVPSLLGILLVLGALVALPETRSYPPRCVGAGDLRLLLPGACAHEDEAPPGVDPTEPVSTRELRAREGAGERAYEAAEELGVAAPTSVAATSPDVTCEGDGTGGYRVQAMYVVEAGRTNRYAALESSIQLWAAGVDDVVNRSAALTGGVRNVRYVTEAGGGGCVAKVLNVTVPAGAASSFNATISAVQALGYTDPTKKYLMWTDASVLCGIASMYPNDAESQGNPNNGSYPQYARIDSGCWGFGDGARAHSVEAHELLHTIGGVQNTSPHSTRRGHCWDESDTMCYSDGGGFAMRQVCAAEMEYFFDCGNDDYFSTYPDPGSYLDGHWNAADSRFLIGGGDGAGGGDAGTPTVLGATIAVNNPAVPGLSTQASVTPALPAGRTLTSVAWTSARADCVFSAPTEVQTDVTCGATAAAPTTVTATLVDSSGATKVIRSPLTFATGTARPVAVRLGAAGQVPADGGGVRVCTSAAFPLVATVVDTASGQPVKGLTAAFTKQTATMTAPAAAGSATSSVDGAATSSQTIALAATYRGRTALGTVYAASNVASLVATPARCTTSLTATADRSAIYYADPVTVSGALTAASGGTPVAAAGVSLAVKLTTADGRVLALGTTKTRADGSYSVVVKPTTSGTITVALAGTTGYEAASATAGAVTVSLPDTQITGAVAPSDVGYGSAVQVTGTLERVVEGVATPLGGKSVGVFVTPTGGSPVKIGQATTTASGTFSVAPALRVSGTLSVSFAGLSGQPAASAAVTTVVAGTWATEVTAAASTTSVPAGTAVTFTGAVTRAYGGPAQPAVGVKVSVYFQASGAPSPTLVTSTTTRTGGAFTAKVYPRSTGTWTLRVLPVAGYAGSAASPVTISVG